MKVPRPILTREHGAWAVVLVPFAAGIGVARPPNLHHLWLVLAALFVFLSYPSLQILVRRRQGGTSGTREVTAARLWGIVFACLAGLFALPVLLSGYHQLAGIGTLAAFLFALNLGLTQRRGKSLAADLVGMLGLTLGAPAAVYVGTGELGITAMLIWILSFLFFASGAFYVHLNIVAATHRTTHIPLSERLRIGFPNLVYHLVTSVLLLLMVLRSLVPPETLLAFIPIIVHAIAGTFFLRSKVRFKTLGLILLGHSLAFLTILVVALS